MTQSKHLLPCLLIAADCDRGRKALIKREEHPFPSNYEDFHLFERAEQLFNINPGNGTCQCCLRDPERPSSWSIAEIEERESELGIKRPIDLRKGFVPDFWSKYGYQLQHWDCLKTAIERYNNYQGAEETLQELKEGKISHEFAYLSGEWTAEDLTNISWDYHVHDTGEGTEIVSKPSTEPTHSTTCHCLGTQYTEFRPPYQSPVAIMNDPEEEPEPEQVDAMEVIWSPALSAQSNPVESSDSGQPGYIDDIADGLI